MKKALAIVLAVLLAAALFTACSNAGSKYAAAGEYICTSMSAEGMTLDPSSLGLEIVLKLHNDGTGSLKYAGDDAVEEPLTWSQDGDELSFSSSRESISAHMEDGAVVMTITDDSGSAQMTFTKK